MNEQIIKLYENAGIKPTIRNKAIARGYYIEHLREEVYPTFTAEKQIELIKEIYPGYPLQYASGNYDNLSFEEGLAYCINNSWKDLMEKQKQQIREILKKERNNE